MNSTSVVIFLVGLAASAFFIAMNELDGLVKNHRAKAWISAISICIGFWSIVFAVIVGIQS